MKFRALITVVLILSTFSILTACHKKKETPKVPPVANAGADQTIQLPVSSVSLSGSGSTNNGTIQAYIWSVVSGPGSPVIANPGVASTTLSELVAGTYVIQLKVIDGAGLYDLDSMSVLVNPPLPQTLTLQPGNNTANELNFAVVGSTNASAHDIDLDAAAWTSGGNLTYLRGAVRFDLSSIPASATIISAKLSLYSNPTPINGNQTDANFGSNNSMFLRRIVSPWDGNTATWATQPSTTTTDQILIPHTTQSTLDLIDIDVKTLVNAMRSSSNYGFMIQLQDETFYNIRQFCSSNHSVTTKRPKLVVVYQ